MSTDGSLLATLKQHFGFDSFLPLQEEIIRDSLAGRDVFALLPTGGGKSLCFQLPALMREGLTVVVSPLIALMKDQVDALKAAGIAATFLNSSLDVREIQSRGRALNEGRYRLLYVAPERVLMGGFVTAMKRWNVSLIAVDEAHCVSEWGHDFRPEYRQLASLRGELPEVPLMALTATATERVRADIVRYLKLRQPACHVGSFNRPNLMYRVVPKQSPYSQVLEFVRARPNESGIVYCHSRKGTEALAERLRSDGINARPYHAGMLSTERTRNQEAFLRDDVPVICATIAFGMGINKPNVRYVLHYDLPKSIESYYQETGRAGRDGLPGECALLFGNGDAGRYLHLFDEITDERERKIARKQLDEMVWYAESANCRRRDLLAYFGEAFEPENCGACDNCQSPRKTFDGTELAKKFLGALVGIRKKSGFGVGAGYVAEVLVGGKDEKLRRWGHDQIEAYGSGKELRKADWSALARELVRQGFLRRDAERFNVLEMTEKGQSMLDGRTQVRLFESLEPSTGRARVAIVCDEVLFERLRALRKRLADERDVPAYVVFSDVALRQMAREYPSNEREFSRISGVGESKLREFGAVFMSEIAEHLRSNPRSVFAEASPLIGTADRLGDSVHESLRRFRAGMSPETIARERGFVVGTIMNHLALAAEAGEELDLARFIAPESEAEIEVAIASVGWQNIVGARERLGGRYEYGVLRIYRAMRSKRLEVEASAGAGETRLRGVSPRGDLDHEQTGASERGEETPEVEAKSVVEGPASQGAIASRTTESPARSPASAPAPA
jgi:ATP-dependent DNA helicase RecQ